jgi:hypothetical protein
MLRQRFPDRIWSYDLHNRVVSVRVRTRLRRNCATAGVPGNTTEFASGNAAANADSFRTARDPGIIRQLRLPSPNHVSQADLSGGISPPRGQVLAKPTFRPGDALAAGLVSAKWRACALIGTFRAAGYWRTAPNAAGLKGAFAPGRHSDKRMADLPVPIYRESSCPERPI